MAYATIQDAKDLYGDDYVLQSVDRDENGDPDAKALTKAFAQASSEMDTYISVRYTVPVSPTPDVLKRFCIDIAIYQLSSHLGGGLTEEKRTRYEDAIKWLTNLAKGVTALPLPDSDEDEQGTTELSAPEERVFTRTGLRNIL